jgi:fibronectin-binding autotransporter adhesin
LNPGASLAMQYVFVHDSNAVNPVVTPPNVDSSDNCFNWLTGLTVSASYTEDSDADGRIDRLRVAAAAAVNDDFAGFFATLTAGYRVDTSVGTNGYSTGANPAAPLGLEVKDNTFYVWLVEQADFDTAATPGLVIRTNTTLSDGASPTPTLLAAGAAVYASNDRAAPVIGFTLARAGTPQVYLRVSEPLAAFGGGPVLPANFTFGALNPQSVASPGSGEYLLSWNPATTTFTANQIINGNTVTCLNLADAANNRLQGAPSVTRRVSDLALGIPGREPINPVLLFDGTAREPGPDGVGYVTVFDGTGWIQDYPDQPNATPSLQANFNAGLSAVRLWWDTNIPAALRKNGLWLPPGSLTSGLVPAGNPGVSAINGLNDPGPPPSAAFAFDVNAEPELVTETLVEFFIEFSVTGIFAARLERPTAIDWYRSVKPWSFGLHKPGGQKGNVNVFNNVINPAIGELAKLHYRLGRAGAVTIQVFGLSGDLVTVLYRGTLGAGDHSTAWNGRNQSGRIVARGLYFIRIVGPDVDETRKILVVKY